MFLFCLTRPNPTDDTIPTPYPDLDLWWAWTFAVDIHTLPFLCLFAQPRNMVWTIHLTTTYSSLVHLWVLPPLPLGTCSDELFGMTIPSQPPPVLVL